MKSKILDKVWFNRYLPTDLWPLILSRVPVKSLLRFRCVSKSWLSLIDDPGFARLHLKTFKNNVHETNLLVVHGFEQHCVIRCSQTFRANSETLLTIGEKSSSRVVCSLDGLVVLKSDLSVFRVWNPSIRKFHEFPSFPVIETFPKYREIGIGYDLLANVYKYVRLIYVGDIIHSVAVYTLGTESWRIIQFQGKECCKEQFKGRALFSNKAVYFHGRLYFIADCLPIRSLFSFDLSSEMFSADSIADGRSCVFRGLTMLGLIDNGSSLAVLHLSPTDNSVWVLESSGEGRRWTKRYSLDSIVERSYCLYHKKNDDVMTFGNRLLIYTDEMGEEKGVIWHKVICSNNGQCKVQKQKGNFSVRMGHYFGYVESLILP